ncbi:MAG: pitrilysin family protein [Acidimicrobiales bacterium]
MPSGIRVVTERMPEARSVSVGVWVDVGSRDEPDELAGVSHFLEHLLFKGTEVRSARSIAVSVDAVGGELDAFTTRETTAFSVRLPADRLSFGLELLTDVVSAPALRPHEVEAEREVILDEILMSEETPDDVAMMALNEALFPGHPLGRETLGSAETVSALSRDSIAAFHAERYEPTALVVAAAGDLQHDRVVDALADFSLNPSPRERPQRTPPEDRMVPLTVVERPSEQVHVVLGWRGVDHDHPDRYALWIANHVLGGGMSSRLFQEVREERGLAYTVYSATTTYRGAGSVVVYAGCAPGRLGELVDVVDSVIDELVERGITAEEHAVALGGLEGSLLLGLEDSGSRMARLGGSEITRGEVIPVDELLRRYRTVSTEDVNRVVAEILGGPRSVVVVGPVDDADPAIARAVRG